MKQRHYIAFLFLLITLVNVALFLYRDKFTWHKYATHSSLYSNDTAKWRTLVEDYPQDELPKAKNILDSAIDLSNLPPDSAILRIGQFLYNRFHTQIGTPSARLLTASPLQQFRMLSASDSLKLWCGNFANMFVFFCWSEGIACRVVEIMNPADHHVLNECYLGRKGEWAVTDVTNNHLLLYDPGKRQYATMIDLRDSRTKPLLSFQAGSGGIVTEPFSARFYDKYFGVNNPINFYYRVNNSEIYKTHEKIRRYFLPVAWYEETDRSRGNIPFFTRQFFILLWLICLVALFWQRGNKQFKLML